MRWEITVAQQVREGNPGPPLGGLFEGAIDQGERTLGALANLAFDELVAFTQIEQLGREMKRSEHGDAHRIHRSRAIGDRAHFAIDVRRQGVGMRLVEITLQVVRVVENFYFYGLAHGYLPPLDSHTILSPRGA